MVIFPLEMLIVPLKIVIVPLIFPLKTAIFALKIAIFPLKMMIFPLEMLIFPLKIVIFHGFQRFSLRKAEFLCFLWRPFLDSDDPIRPSASRCDGRPELDLPQFGGANYQLNLG